MVTKAIVLVAGWGTRRLPITKTIEKCMLPVGNRPLVDYVVQDCLKAGITDIIFVVSEQSEQIRDYYRSNIDLNDYLRRNGKAEMLELVRPIKATMHFVVQPSYGKYGTAIAVALGADYVSPGESAIVVGGDDFIYNADGSSEIARLIAQTPEGTSGVLGVAVPKGDTTIQRYGFIETNERGELVSIIEHPNPEPEHFVKNVSKYLLSSEMLTAVREYAKTDKESGEYGIFDPFEAVLSRGAIMKVVTAVGAYLDGGTVESWLYANQVIVAEGLKK